MMIVTSHKSSGCVSVVCLKYCLCLYNFIFLLCGCIVFGLGLWTVLEKWEMVLMMPGRVYEVTIWLMMTTGAVSVLISLLGYSAVAFESRHLLAWYTIFLVLVFISSSVIGLLSYVYQDRLLEDLQSSLTENFISNYSVDQDRTLAADNIQIKLSCCGSESHLDWSGSSWQTSHQPLLVPDSCCKSPSVGCGLRDHPSNIHYTGCRHSFQQEISSHLVYVCGISVCIALLQVLGTILTSGLFSRLHRIDKYTPPATNNGQISNWDSE